MRPLPGDTFWDHTPWAEKMSGSNVVRCKSFLGQEDDHFLAVCRYVERNADTAGLCDAPDPWRFGSLWRWAHGTTSEKSLLAA